VYHFSNVCLLVVLAIMLSYTTAYSQKMRDFTLTNVNGDKVKLSDIQGERLTVVDFWATWCKPCTKAMPKLDKIHKDYKDQGLSVIGISCDGPRSAAKVGPMVQSLDIDYHILSDIDCEVMNTYGYQAFPTLVVLDEKRKVKWVHEGFISGDEKEIGDRIAELLK